MHFISKRINTLKDAFNGLLKDDTFVKRGNLDDFIAQTKEMKVVGQYTMFTSENEYSETHEQLSWVDPEGFDFGWKFGEYIDEHDNVDYIRMEESFRKDFDKAVGYFRKDVYSDMFIKKDKDYNRYFVFFVDGAKLGPDDESLNEVYVLVHNILDGFLD